MNTLIRLITYCIAFTFADLVTHAQIATYSFENSINDNADTYSSVYQIKGVDAALDASIFVTGGNNTGIQLSPTESIQLPLELSQAIVANSSFEINLNVKYIDDGNPEYDGVKPIFTLKGDEGWGSPGFTLLAQKNFGNEGSFSLVLLHADGWGEANGSEPSFYNLFGNFTAGQWLEVTIIFDFLNDAIIAAAGNAYSQIPFDPNFDIDRFKSEMASMNVHFGWINGMAERFDSSPNIYTATVVIDEVEIHVPRKPASTSDLVAALTQMTNHVNGSSPLSSSALEQQAQIVNSNYIGKYFEAKDAFDRYIQAYEAANPPMFPDETLLNVPNQSPEFFIAFQLQQEVFDKGFIPGRMTEMAGMKFEAHENWPGKVSASAPRLNNQQVEINGTYILDPGYLLLGEEGGARRPTGYYAAPGELVQITVDPSWVNQGVHVYIGGHINDLGNKLDKTNRFVRISKEVEITQQTTPIANPFGGAIYLRIPPGLSLGWSAVEIDGAVKAPYYRSLSGRKTSAAEFVSEVNKGHVSWMDVESEYWMTTLPSKMLGDNDIEAVMNGWDNMWKAVMVASGRPEQKNRSEYFMFDRRMATESIGAGYPMALGLDEPVDFEEHQNNPDNPLRILDEDWLRNSTNGTIVHEMGHNMRFPTLGDEIETIVQLVGVPAYNVGLGHPLDSAWKYVENENHTSDLAAINWMIAQNFRDGQPMGCDPTMADNVEACNEKQYQMRGFGKYVDVARLFGWEGLGGVFKHYYDYWTAGGERMDREFVSDSSMIHVMNTQLGKNMNPLLHFWGLIPSSGQAAEFSSYPVSEEVYQRLVYYRDLVPLTRAEFQPWYLQLFRTVDPVHHERLVYTLNNYDTENLGQKIVDQINFILTTYYGNNDNDGDGYDITQECDDFNANVNPGMTEIIYNGLDDDCDPTTLDDDLDQDGYVAADDCNDSDPSINPGVQDIPNNNIDEDCNGADLVLSLGDEEQLTYYPNPVTDYLNIETNASQLERVIVTDFSGRSIVDEDQNGTSCRINLSNMNEGIYVVTVFSKNGGMTSHKVSVRR